ncbi:MAG: short-chain dehydrogenase [Oligoflexia bacterium]|nr:MAG: short-chain dehydrogenase [Oligoflexia bacterium]
MSAWGVVRWIPYGFKMTDSYPGFEHATTMVGGFLLSFAAGFMMTAVPKFTGTWSAKWSEIIPLQITIAALPLTEYLLNPFAVYINLLLSFIQIFLFVSRRFISKQGQPPDSFLMIGIGLMSAIVGLLILLYSESTGIANSALYNLGRNLFFHCFILVLIVGIGSRIIPSFSGWGPQIAFLSRFSNTQKALKIFFLSMGALIVFSYFIESFYHPIHGRIFRAFIVTLIALSFWKIYLLPVNRTRLSWGLWISSWGILVGIWGGSLMPNYLIHWHHVTLINGFGLLTLMISTRVILAHGGHNLMIETKSKSYYWIIGLAILGATTRLSAGLIPSTYFTHLAYAAIVWILALSIWSYSFGLKIRWKE